MYSSSCFRPLLCSVVCAPTPEPDHWPQVTSCPPLLRVSPLRSPAHLISSILRSISISQLISKCGTHSCQIILNTDKRVLTYLSLKNLTQACQLSVNCVFHGYFYCRVEDCQPQYVLALIVDLLWVSLSDGTS